MRSVLLTIMQLALVMLLIGCQGLTGQQRLWLADGERAYQQQRYQRAIWHLTRFVDNAPDLPEIGRALYVRGLAYARSDQRLAARSDLARCVTSAEDPDVQWRAYTVLGTLDFEDRQWANAARSYAAAARVAPKKPPTDIILYRLGLCLERCGRWNAVREPYERIVSEFPTGGAGRDARRRLQIKADYFAVQCGVFAGLKNAENLVTDLGRQSLRARIRREPRNGVFMHVVLVGQYTNYEQALHELARIKGYVPKAVLWP